MSTIKKFEEIEAWQKARILTNELFKISTESEQAKDFTFRNQINAACGSIMDNIAEGFERGGKLECINFLTIAKGSCAEVRSQLYRIFDRGIIKETQFDNLYKLTEEIGNRIGGLINYLNISVIKGRKFKDRVP